MKTHIAKFPLMIVGVYLLVVVTCIFLAFDFEGAIDTSWTLALIVLTLPWSLASILFVWALIHGAGLEFFTFMYLVFAGLNSVIFYRLYSRFRSKSDAYSIRDAGNQTRARNSL